MRAHVVHAGWGPPRRPHAQCPCHDWKFDITTGEFVAAKEITVQTYLCKSQDGKIQVKLEEQR